LVLAAFARRHGNRALHCAHFAALASHAEVTLWTTQRDWDRKLQKHAEVRHYETHYPPLAELNREGVSVYHIGNNPLHHGSIWQLSRQHGGMIVLHDTRLHHFSTGCIGSNGKTSPDTSLRCSFTTAKRDWLTPLNPSAQKRVILIRWPSVIL
jgi:hypothetical protein